MKKPAAQCSPHEVKLADKRVPKRRNGRRPRHRSTIPQRLGDRASGDDDDAAPRKYLTAPDVWHRYGVSDMTLHRWIRHPTMEFPPPSLVINRYRYWDEAVLRAWELQRATGGST